MPLFKNNPISESIVGSVLGSTEGVFYETDAGVWIDRRFEPIVSTGDSGLSFGFFQFDVANSGTAKTLFTNLLDDAVTNNRITSNEKNDWLNRASTQGLLNDPAMFSTQELARIESDVLVPGRSLSVMVTANQNQMNGVINEIDEVFEAVNTKWGGLGVFDSSDTDYYLAVGHLASWSNRTGNLNTMEVFLSGGNVTGLTSLTQAPTYSDVEYYLTNQAQFVNNPGEFANVTGNIERGENTFPDFISDTVEPQAGDGDNTPGSDNNGATKDSFADEVEAKVGEAENEASPLALDIDGNGIELVSLNSANAIYWDIDNDGFAEASGWISGGDGLLAIDLNNDNIINNSTELFGDQTGYSNGFLALAAYDSNNDGVINSSDAQFSNLLVWVDDGDSFSDSVEIFTLDDLSITEINLGYSDVNYSISGNNIKQESTFTINGNTRDIVDVYFAYDNVNTIYNQDFTFDFDAANLPDLRGYGELPRMLIAMSLDNDDLNPNSLISLVTTLNSTTFTNLFDETTGVRDDIREILFRWAGVDGVVAGSRGLYVDAQELEFLEKMMGQDFLQRGAWSNPFVAAAEDMTEAFDIAYNNFYARLLAQSAGGELFAGNLSYNATTDAIEGITGLDSTKISELQTEATALSTTAERDALWQNVVRVIEFSIGTANLPTTDFNTLDAAITASDATLDLNDIVAALGFNGMTGTYVGGTSGDDVLAGTGGHDTLEGFAGNDTLTDDVGHDTLKGGDGADTLTGGVGSDYLLGGNGDDNYIYNVGDGEDVINETSGTADKITFGAGIALTDLTFTRVGNADLMIEIDASVGAAGKIVVEDYFGYGAQSGSQIESLVFNDLSTFNPASVDFTLNGLETGEYLYGVTAGGTTNDTIYGNGGDDTIYAGAGTNTAYGGAGNDHIEGGSGTDVLYGDAGDDELRGFDGTNTLQGGAGDDTVRGGAGNDNYIYDSGDDYFIEGGYGAGAGGTDVIDMAAGITLSDLSFARYSSGYNDLIVTIAGQGTLTLGSHYYNSYYKFETIRFSDQSTLDLSTLTGVVFYGTSGNDVISGSNTIDDVFYGLDGSDTLRGYSGNDSLYGGNGDDWIYGGYGNDYLDGGAGDDYIEDSNGNDTYIYQGGMDTVYDTYGTDVIRLEGTTTVNDLSFTVSGDHVTAVIDAGVNEIQFLWFNYGWSGYYEVETIEFTDGFSADLTGYSSWLWGSSGNDVITGNSSNNTLIGKAGNDTINANAGNDNAHGGAGNDTLNGGTGDDLLHGGAGTDTLHGDAGNDVLYGGDGLDTLYGDGGADSFVLMNATAFNDVDVLQDFSISESDSINIADVLSLYDQANDVITDFVQITDNGTDSTLSVDVDGGADNFVAIASIVGVTGLTDEVSLETNGYLIAA